MSGKYLTDDEKKKYKLEMIERNMDIYYEKVRRKPKLASACSDENLEYFSNLHYTYINQIFGDGAVRDLIEEIYPNPYQFDVQETGAEFEFSFHHIVKNRKTGKIVCSVDDRYQDININKHDTLCQSYSLLNFFKIRINKDQIQRQMDMIDMYRTQLLGKKQFVDGLSEIIKDPDNKEFWRDYTAEESPDEPVYLKMNPKTIIKQIREVLTEWREYGHWYFFLEGKCPEYYNDLEYLQTLEAYEDEYEHDDSSSAAASSAAASSAAASSAAASSAAASSPGSQTEPVIPIVQPIPSPPAPDAPAAVHFNVPSPAAAAIKKTRIKTKKNVQYSKYLRSKKTRGKTQRRKTQRRK